MISRVDEPPEGQVDAPAAQRLDASSSTDAHPAGAFCDPADPDIIACFDFDDGTAADKSAHHFPVHAIGLQFLAGEVGLALQFLSDSAADFDDSPVFDVASLTIEAWVHPDAFQNSVSFVVDVNGQYAIQVTARGQLSCLLANNPGVESLGTDDVPLQQWTHVACTYDRATGLARLYLNGRLSNSTTGGGYLPTNGTTGMSIGADNPPISPPSAAGRDRFLGEIDELRLSSRARSDHEICIDAAQPTCP